MKNYMNGYGECNSCGASDVMLIDTSDSDWTDFDEVCGNCIKKHGDRMHREMKREKHRQSDLGGRDTIHYGR